MNFHFNTDTSKPAAAFLLSQWSHHRVYGKEERADIARLARVFPEELTADNWRDYPEICSGVDVLFSSWGAPEMDAEFLAAFPRLKAVFYGAGSVKGFVTDALWQRGIVVTSAYAANAIPVSEYTVAQIVLCAKHFWRLASDVRQRRSYPDKTERESPGMFGATVVGLVSLGSVGRLVAQRLRGFGVRILACDPFVDPQVAASLGVELCTLEALFERADVVSCHAPLLPQTMGMIRREHFAAMKTGASFINTARGAVIDEQGLAEVLGTRPDLWALLDVCQPEPPAPDSPLYALPNIVLTPHIAGSKGGECLRLGRVMVEEFRRYLAGEPLRYGVDREQTLLMA